MVGRPPYDALQIPALFTMKFFVALLTDRNSDDGS